MSQKQCLFNNSVFLVLALGLISCSDSDKGAKVVTPWEVQAPYFKTYNNQTDEASKSQTLNRLDLDTENLKLSATDELVFEDAEKYPGSTLSAVTTCTGLKDQAYKQTFRLSLFKENAVYRFLPEALLLMPETHATQFKCAVHFVARTPNGSTHDFGQNIHFTLNAENRELLAKLEDETEPEVHGAYHNLATITLQRARYFYLPRIAPSNTYRLKCSEFESSSAHATQLLQLIEAHSATQTMQVDQLCRLFIQDQNGIVQTSKLFNLRFFDTKNYVELTEQKAAGTSGGSHLNFEIKRLVLYNRTKYPIFFAVDNANLRAVMTIRGQNTEHQASGELGFSKDAGQHPNNIRRLPNKSISVLLPGQKLIPVLHVRGRDIQQHVTIFWTEKMPTLDILEKKSWDDPNEKVLTSIPLMDGPSASAFVPGISGI